MRLWSFLCGFFGLKAEFGDLELNLGWAEITMGLGLVALLVNGLT